MVIRQKRDAPTLAVVGLVGEPRRFSPEELRELPAVEARVPGRKGRPDTVGPAFQLRELLDRVRPAPEATHATCASADGLYTASIPLADLRDRGLVMHTPDGPSPWRLVVPEGATLCWNVKGLASLELTDREIPDSVPEAPSH